MSRITVFNTSAAIAIIALSLSSSVVRAEDFNEPKVQMGYKAAHFVIHCAVGTGVGYIIFKTVGAVLGCTGLGILGASQARSEPLISAEGGARHLAESHQKSIASNSELPQTSDPLNASSGEQLLFD